MLFRSYPESSWSVGQFLEQWVCCFFNALIIEELNYQIYRLEKYADIRLDHDVVAKGVEALRRNLQVLAEHAELGQFSRKWLGCPLLVAVIRKELRDSIKKAVEKKAVEASWDEKRFQDSLPVNREPGGAGEEKTSALADVDVYSQLCSLMYQVMPPFPENSEKQAWQKRAETYGYPTPKNGLGEKNPSDGR